MSLINSLITQLQADPYLLVNITELSPHAIQAKNVVISMVNSLPQGVFLDFLHEYVRYHVDVFGAASNDSLLFHDGRVLLSSLEGVGNNSIIYMLYHLTNTVEYYIGSASNAINRLGQHQDSIRGLRVSDSIHYKLLSIGDPSGVMWQSVYGLTNYYKLATTQLPSYHFSQGEVMILHALTEFVLRILEESLITQFPPTLNYSVNPVLFTYTS